MKVGTPRAKLLTEFRKSIFFNGYSFLRSTFYPTDAFLSRELLTFYALDLLDMCQVVSLLPFAFVSTLQTAGKRLFFSTSVHFLAVLKQIFEQFAVPIDSNSLMFKKNTHTKKNRVLFSPKFLTCSVTSYHIIPDASETEKRGGHSPHCSHRSGAFSEHPPICSPFSSFCSVSNAGIPRWNTILLLVRRHRHPSGQAS